MQKYHCKIVFKIKILVQYENLSPDTEMDQLQLAIHLPAGGTGGRQHSTQPNTISYNHISYTVQAIHQLVTMSHITDISFISVVQTVHQLTDINHITAISSISVIQTVHQLTDINHITAISSISVIQYRQFISLLPLTISLLQVYCLQVYYQFQYSTYLKYMFFVI